MLGSVQRLTTKIDQWALPLSITHELL